MMRRRGFIGSVLGGIGASFLSVERATAKAGGLRPPPLALSAGFSNLIFYEEFDRTPDIGFGTDGHKWNAGLWWEPIPSRNAFSVSDSILTISSGTNPEVNLCTQYHDASGGTQFLGGYFEARMSCTDWSAFWLFCWDRATVYGDKVLPSNPLTWTNEIDIVETDGGSPNSVWCTLHRNSSADSLPDEQNYPAQINLNTSAIGAWHVYGLLWTQQSVTWFVDDIPVLSVPPYASTWQPVQLVLTAAPGGVNGSMSQTVPPITQIDWVRVWHQ
ncbi:MAG: family 16 glycosylhydrolase [Verrucomicrobia bacterium]|nr:family 16 glycosylhydrolase [Verrucomicrobiota bacterium]MBV8481982.1 family 16 glycosylhydrolase [Verrucomicrobiota bacterium]